MVYMYIKHRGVGNSITLIIENSNKQLQHEYEFDSIPIQAPHHFNCSLIQVLSSW